MDNVILGPDPIATATRGLRRPDADFKCNSEPKSFEGQALDALSANIAILDPDGTIVTVNRAWREFAAANGSGPSDANVCEGANYLHACDSASGRCSDEATAMAAGIRSVLSGQQREFVLEYPCHSPETPRWYNVRVTPLRTDGRPNALVTHEDITERRQTEDMLRRSEHLYHGLFENMLNGLAYCKIIVDDGRAVDFTYLAVNSAFSSLTGLNDVVGKRVSEVIPGVMESDPDLIETYGRVALTGNPETFETYVEALKMWFSISVYCPAEDHFVAVFDVITERKQAEETLRLSENKYRGLYHCTSDAVMLLDESGYIDCNTAALAVFGCRTREELCSKHPADLSPPTQPCGTDSLTLATVRVREAMSLGNSRFEWIHQRADTGTAFAAEVLLNTMDLNGVRVLQAVVRDITERKAGEVALRDSEAKLRTLLDTLPDLVWLKDTEGVYLACNRRFESFFGAPEKDIVGKTDYDFAPSDLADFFRQRDAVAIAAGGPTTNEEEVVFAVDGHKELLETIKTPVHSSDGRLVGVLGVARDMTGRKQMEDALRGSEAKLAEAMRIAELGAWEYDVAADLFTLNDQIYVIFDTTAEREGGYTMPAAQLAHRFVHPDEQSLVGTNIQKALETTDADYQAKLDVRTVDANGDTRHQTVNIRVEKDASGRTVKLYGVNQDITERVRAEVESAMSKRDFEQFFGLVPDLVAVVSTDGFLKRANPAWEKALGYSSRELLSRPFETLIHPDDIELTRNVNQGQVDGASVIKFENRYRHKNGSYRWLEWNATAAIGDLKYAVARDVTERKRVEEELRYKNVILATQLETSLDGILVVNEDSKVILSHNERFARMWGIPNELIENGVDELVLKHNMDQVADPDSFLSRVKYLNDHTYETSHDEFALKSGSTFERYSAPMIGPDERCYGRVWYFRDVTAARLAEAALRESEARYRAVTESANDAIITADTMGTIVGWNIGSERIFGYSESEICGQAVTVLIPDSSQTPHSIEFGRATSNADRTFGQKTLERMGRRKDGSDVPLELSFSQWEVNGCLYLTAIIRDITERKAMEERMAFQVNHDPLTNLPNRVLFLDRLAQALARTARSGRNVAVLFLDVDKFKLINDSLGHAAGDSLLICVAERLLRVLRISDTAARFAGDEFTVLIDDVGDESDARAVADRLQAEFRRPVTLATREVFVNVSMGIALSARWDDDPVDLMRNADAALYTAKSRGRGRHEVFDTHMNAHALQRLEMETELRRAVDRKELVLHYQPIISLTTGVVKGFEALVRWNHPTRGLISPLDFVPLAEETRLILPIGRWILHEACRQMQEWRERYTSASEVYVAVNLSARQFQQPSLLAEVTESLDESSLPPSCLTLEITESVVMDETEFTLLTLAALKAAGVRIAIDDFGTGYSSLSYLRRFPVDYLKIDRSFIDCLDNGSDDCVIVSSTINLAHSLGLQVIGEGAESAEQVNLLRQLSCDTVQGYYFHRPLAPPEVETLLATGQTNHEAAIRP